MSGHRSLWKRRADGALILCFLLLVCLPLCRTILGPRSAVLASELRTSAPLPALRVSSAALLGFPSQFDAFFNDCFGFRDALIRMLTIAKMQWLGVSPSSKVTIGRDGWLFSSDLPGTSVLPAVRSFSDVELTRWQKILENRRDWLAQRGIRYIFIFAPNKESIYPEFLPRPLARQKASDSRMGQLVAHLRANSNVHVVDLRAPLLRAKSTERVFDRTDTHWNERGAYAGYCEIVKAMSEVPEPRELFDDSTEWRHGGDLARMLNAEHWIPEKGLMLKRKESPRAIPAGKETTMVPGPIPFAMECNDPALPRAVFFCDSFAIRAQPLLSEHFARILYSWQMIFPTFETQAIERERPDIVIQEMIERKLNLPVPEVGSADPLASQTETWAAARP